MRHSSRRPFVVDASDGTSPGQMSHIVTVPRPVARWAVLVAVCFLVLLLAIAVTMGGGSMPCTTTASVIRYQPPTCPADSHYLAIGVAITSGAAAAAALLCWYARSGARTGGRVVIAPTGLAPRTAPADWH